MKTVDTIPYLLRLKFYALCYTWGFALSMTAFLLVMPLVFFFPMFLDPSLHSPFSDSPRLWIYHTESYKYGLPLCVVLGIVLWHPKGGNWGSKRCLRWINQYRAKAEEYERYCGYAEAIQMLGEKHAILEKRGKKSV